MYFVCEMCQQYNNSCTHEKRNLYKVITKDIFEHLQIKRDLKTCSEFMIFFVYLNFRKKKKPGCVRGWIKVFTAKSKNIC